MAKTPGTLSPQNIEFIETVLDRLSFIDDLTTPKDETSLKAVGFSELYDYAINPEMVPRDELLTALESNTQIRAGFERLLRNTARFRMPQVAAASTGDIDVREASGCRILFRNSRANDSQVYVILELNDPLAPSPTHLFICARDKAYRKLFLPVFQDGRIQLLVDRESDILQGLKDIETEVILL